MFKKAVVALSFLLATSVSLAAQDFSECRQFFANEKIPVVQHQTELQTRALCFSSFAVLHSGVSHTPVYVAEKLNKATVEAAKGNERTNRFFADARLPRSERAELDDYKGSDYDRGHMAPAGDMATDEGMAQSFSLANMVPQAPENNRKTWASIEKATRKYISRADGDVYIISGPVFDTHPEMIGSNKVWVPKFLFKLVYDSTSGKAWAHWIENTNSAKVGKPITYAELVQRTGVNFIPSLNNK